MNNYSNLAISFLKIILWLSLISASFGIIIILIGFSAIALGLDFPILNNINFTIGNEAVALSELKKTNLISFIIFGTLAVGYLWLFIKLTRNALNILSKVNFQNPFNSEISNLISKLGNTALLLGIFNIVLGSAASILYHDKFVLDFNFENFNFLIMAAILYIVSLVFKKGTELQSENDLTI